MSNVEQLGGYAGGFSNVDKTKAEVAWGVYVHEVDGGGFLCEFDLLPGEVDTLMQERILSPIDHFLNHDKFQSRLRKFGMFVSILADFKDRPVTVPHPGGFEDQALTHNVDESHVGAYREFYDSLLIYSDALIQNGPSSAHVYRAASQLAQLVNPHEWRAAGYTALPENTQRILDLDTPGYLCGVMNTVQA